MRHFWFGFEQFVGSKTTFRLINNAWTRYCHDHRSSLPAKYASGALVLFGHGAKRHFVDLCTVGDASYRTCFYRSTT
jgi:hypothetical protein